MHDSAVVDVKGFLRQVEQNLVRDLRTAERTEPVRDQVARIVKEARKASNQAHLRLPEAAFLNTWLPPAVAEALRQYGYADSKRVFLAESYRGLQQFCGDTAARSRPFPFKKGRKADLSEVFQRWSGSAKKAFIQPCPDFAVDDPFRVVIEGKYFRGGSAEFAQRQLVTAISEALFYLGVPASSAGNRPWSYDYACLVAYDASNGQTLAAAWQTIKLLKQRFWDDANLYVIVIGEGAS